jgi:hypothetical protein
MPQSLEEARSKIVTSLHGRRIGLDDDERLIGIKGRREVVTEATSDTTATKLPNYGVVTVVSSNEETWVIEDPIPGCEVKILTGSTSTGNHYINTDTATFKSSFGSTQTQIDMLGGGAGLTLIGLSTSLWGILTKSSTTAVTVTS